MKFLNQLLSDKGSVSSMRVMSLSCVLTAIMIAIIGLMKPAVDYSGLALLCGTFLGAGFGGKIAQKKSELPDQVPPSGPA